MWKKILGGLVVLIVVVVSLAMYATSGMTKVADEFFIHVKSGHYDDAYNMLSEDFKSSTSQETFQNFLIQNALTNYKESSWDSRSYENNIGKLEGTITTKSGGTIPLNIQFIKHGETWQIYSIFKPATGVQNERTQTQTPQQTIAVTPPTESKTGIDDAILFPMIQDSTMAFAYSVNERSMSKLYAYISDFWKQRTTVKDLDGIFNAFYQVHIDLTVLKDITPILEKQPQVTNGELNIKGYYPTSPSKVYFDYSYIQEDGTWKMTGININVK